MGSLSNLYISQSYQSLIHLATNNTASATLIDLQDGLGNSIGVSVNTGGDLYLSGSLTASLQQGYLYVGGASGKTYAFPTSSLVSNVNTSSLVTTASFNSYTASNDSKVNQLIQATGSYATTGSNVFYGNQVIAGNISAISASFQYVTTIFETASVIYSSGSNQFGDELTDVQTLSGSVKVQGTLTLNGTNVLTASIPLTSLNDFTASQNQKNTTLESVTSSLNAYTQSNDQKWSNLAGQSGSWVTSTITASSLVTASFDNGTRNLTFTKGDTTQFSVNIPDVSGSTINTGSFVTTSSFNAYTSSTDNRLNNLESTSASVNISISNLNSFTASNGNTSLNAYTASTNLWTASIDSKFSTLQTLTASYSSSFAVLSSLTGSYATTGSNNFRGAQKITNPANSIAADNNGVILTAHSGSLILTNSTFTTGSYGYISASSAGQTNIIFQQNSVSPDFILSGSFNIISMPAAPTAGFKRFIGIGNIALGGSNIPLMSGSMAFPITFNQNYFSGPATTITMRGPVSSSAWTIAANNILGTINIGTSVTNHAQSLTSGLSMQSNQVNGTLNINANQGSNFNIAPSISTNLVVGNATLNLSSSAAAFTNNIINDSAFILTNQFYSSSIGLGNLNVIRNNIAGSGNQIIASGSQPTGTTTLIQIADNFIGGSGNIIYDDISNARVSGVTAYHTAARNMIYGNNLIISGSSLATDVNSMGSAFFGRWNALDNRREKTAETIFAVGTGTSTARKTGFLIDSGSNTSIEGSLRVSGSSTLSGSFYIQSGSTLPNTTGSAILTWNPTTGQVSQASFAQINSASLSVGAWQDTTTQSGSADVAYPFTFNTTDITDGIILSGSSGLQITKKGFYDLQWSGQLSQGASAANVSIWLRKNGTDIPGSAGRISAASNTNYLPAWNYILDLNVNDVIQIVWGSTSANTTWEFIPAATIYPSCASIIVSLAQVR